eukprot:507712_1
MAAAVILLTFVFRSIVSSSFELPPIPLTDNGVNQYLQDISTMWNEYYAGENIVNVFQNIFDKDIIMCAHKDVCTVGIGKALSNLAQFQSYFKRGWMTTKSASIELISYDDNSISYTQNGVFATAFPMPSMSGFTNDFNVSQHSINIFNETNGKVSIIQMDNIYDDNYDNAFTEFRGALFRLFAGFKTKAQAEYEVAVINGIIDGDKQLPSTNNKLVFGFIDKDIFVSLSGVIAIIVFIFITIYFCYQLCCSQTRKINKKQYQKVKDTDQSSTDTETEQ